MSAHPHLRESPLTHEEIVEARKRMFPLRNEFVDYQHRKVRVSHPPCVHSLARDTEGDVCMYSFTL
jgi:hypothetical protein